jgi:hypothetical protein
LQHLGHDIGRNTIKGLGHDIARNTIKAILKDHGIEPAPQRGANMPWKTFLAAHWDGLAAADFFSVEVLTLRGLARYVVLFVMKLKTRTVEIAGITAEPDETWMTQITRNLTAADDGFLRGMQHIILDRDPLYTAAFRLLLRDSGVTPLVLPARSPNLNAFAGPHGPALARGGCPQGRGREYPRPLVQRAAKPRSALVKRRCDAYGADQNHRR